MATGQATIRLPCPVHPCNIVLLSFDKKVVSKGMTKYVKNTRRIKTNSIFTPIYLFLNNFKLNLWTRLGFCQNRPDLPPGRLGHPKPKIPNNNVSNVNNPKTVTHSAMWDKPSILSVTYKMSQTCSQEVKGAAWVTIVNSGRYTSTIILVIVLLISAFHGPSAD